MMTNKWSIESFNYECIFIFLVVQEICLLFNLSAGRVPVLDDVVYPWLANPEEIPILGIVA